MEKIKLQARDKEGQLLAYNNDCLNVNEAMALKESWEVMYKGFVHIITINFIQC
jgi:hypothetical protein